MPILPYCIVSDGVPVPEIVTGVAEARIERLQVGALACLYSEVAELPKDPGEVMQAAMRFQSVVQQVFGAGTVIPFRFPHLLENLEDLREFMARGYDTYTGALQRLSGMTQVEVKLTRKPQSPSAGEPTSGTEYLKARQAEFGAMQDTIAEFVEAGRAHAVEWRTRESPEAIRCYALVPHAGVADLKKSLSTVRPKPSIRAVVSGPWPPGEFVERSA